VADSIDARGATTAPVLAARGLTKRYGGITAVSNVDVEVGAGEVCGLIGPNGAGKTTMFDLISGAQQSTAGTVSLEGQDVTRRSATWRARHGMRRTFQRQQPFAHLSVEDNLRVARRHRLGLEARRGADPAVEQALEQFGLTGMRHQLTGGLTIGQTRLMELARAVVAEPRLLLLDEPTSGLADHEIEYLRAFLSVARKDLSCGVLLVEHDMSFVMAECQRIVVLALGQVLTVGTPDEVRAHPEVVAAYLGTSAGQTT
jgi:branched-chain amino acid transport system ATP-binding protein